MVAPAEIPRAAQALACAARSFLYAVLQVALTPPFALFALATFPLPARQRYRLISSFARTMIYLARVICGIHHRVLGRENLPSGPCVVLAKHQSAWETMALQLELPPQVWVLKRELLYIPFFGWGLAMTNPIAIDRGNARRALRQIVHQGKERLANGFWVVVFPEGTRVAPGTTRPYQIGGAWLATETEAPVVPIAHNAGEYWRRNAFLKRPGEIILSIGPAIDTRRLTPHQVNERARDWIEQEIARFSSTAATSPRLQSSSGSA